MIVSLVIILGLFVVFLAFTWYVKMKPQVYKTVSAGDTNKDFSSEIELRTNIYDCNLMISKKVKVNPEKYDVYVVIGDSMKRSHIDDHDFILVERLCDADKYSIEKDDVLLLKIDRNKDSRQDSSVEFKLRKHISYINSTNDFNAWVDELAREDNDISAEKESIRKKYDECIEKYKQNNSNAENYVFTFSSTFDESKKAVKYSFHPIKFLNGIVNYVIKNEEIPD
jgi:cell division protein FtsI/penicillin-binding protein 2